MTPSQPYSAKPILYLPTNVIQTLYTHKQDPSSVKSKYGSWFKLLFFLSLVWCVHVSARLFVAAFSILFPDLRATMHFSFKAQHKKYDALCKKIVRIRFIISFSFTLYFPWRNFQDCLTVSFFNAVNDERGKELVGGYFWAE